MLGEVNVPQHLVCQLRIIVLLRKDMHEFSHRLRKMLKIRQVLNDRGLRS